MCDGYLSICLRFIILNFTAHLVCLALLAVTNSSIADCLHLFLHVTLIHELFVSYGVWMLHFINFQVNISLISSPAAAVSSFSQRWYVNIYFTCNMKCKMQYHIEGDSVVLKIKQYFIYLNAFLFYSIHRSFLNVCFESERRLMYDQNLG